MWQPECSWCVWSFWHIYSRWGLKRCIKYNECRNALQWAENFFKCRKLTTIKRFTQNHCIRTQTFPQNILCIQTTKAMVLRQRLCRPTSFSHFLYNLAQLNQGIRRNASHEGFSCLPRGRNRLNDTAVWNAYPSTSYLFAHSFIHAFSSSDTVMTVRRSLLAYTSLKHNHIPVQSFIRLETKYTNNYCNMYQINVSTFRPLSWRSHLRGRNVDKQNVILVVFCGCKCLYKNIPPPTSLLSQP